MSLYNDLKAVIIDTIGKPDESKIIYDTERDSKIKIRNKDFGNVKYNFSEEFDIHELSNFFVLNMVEVKNSNKQIDFNRYLWQNDDNISRIVKISCDIHSGAVITCCVKSDNKFDQKWLEKKRIIATNGCNYALEYNFDYEVKKVEVGDILNKIKNKNIDKFYKDLRVIGSPSGGYTYKRTFKR